MCFTFITDSSPWDWKQVALHSQFTQNTYVNSLLVDPRELYIEDIFWSGKFSLQTISKAISVSQTHIHVFINKSKCFNLNIFHADHEPDSTIILRQHET